MIFNDHEKLRDQHAFLSASGYHWLRWDDETLTQRFYGRYSQTIGTALHELASNLIKNRIKLAKHDKKIIELHLINNQIPRGAYDAEKILDDLLPFVNDAIGYRMESEVILFYSMSCFGTADAITFDEFNKVLRIHDYKSGTTPVKMDQLKIYAALFCLEYKKNPFDFAIELKIYQDGSIMECLAEPTEIEAIMKDIVEKNKKILKLMEGEYRR